MDTDKEISFGPVGKLCPVAQALVDIGSVAWHDVGGSGIYDLYIGECLFDGFPQLEGDGEGDVLFFGEEAMSAGIESTVAGVDDDGVEGCFFRRAGDGAEGGGGPGYCCQKKPETRRLCPIHQGILGAKILIPGKWRCDNKSIALIVTGAQLYYYVQTFICGGIFSCIDLYPFGVSFVPQDAGGCGGQSGCYAAGVADVQAQPSIQGACEQGAGGGIQGEDR